MEEITPSKSPKVLEISPPTQQLSSYPDWHGQMQAYYEGGTPVQFFTSPVTSSNGHAAYVWAAGQHPMMSAYGNPLAAFPAMYPHHHGGVYVHPSIAMTTQLAYTPSEQEEKPPLNDSRKTSNKKKRKNKAGGNNNKTAASSSGTEIASQSGTSASDGSLDATITNDKIKHEPTTTHKKGKFGQMLAEVAKQQNTTKSCVPGMNLSVTVPPTTKLAIGMSLGNGNSVAAAAASIMQVKQENGGVKPTEQWTQDDRELKLQRRKQSNRESARRSRQRKQAECEELQKRVDLLYDHNRNLARDLSRLVEECKKLSSENEAIQDELINTYGPEAVSDLEGDNLTDDQHNVVEVKAVVNEEVAAAAAM